MSYNTCGYIVDCTIMCEKCISKNTSRIELEVLNGNVSSWELKYWPVRNQDGSTKISKRGAVVMKKVSGMKKVTPRTFDGETIETFSEYSYGETEGEAVMCECGTVLIEAYTCKCRSCGGDMEGRLSQEMDCRFKYAYCEECLAHMVQINQIPEKLERMQKRLHRITQKSRKNRVAMEAFLYFEPLMQALDESTSPSEFGEYLASELDRLEYLAHKGNPVSKILFRLVEYINTFTWMVEEIGENVDWDDLEQVEEMQEKVEHYHNYGWC